MQLMEEDNIVLQSVSNQNLKQNEPQKKKKRMTSLKNPSSKYKNTLTKILCHYYPIHLNNTLATQCQAQVGYLWIGGLGVLNSEELKKHQIRAILTVLDYKKYEKENIAEKIEELEEIQQHQFIDVTEDHEDISPYLNHSCDFINSTLERGLNLLVHSKDGLSRSPGIVIHYIMKKYRIKFHQAYQIVKARKPQIQIKSQLIKQLETVNY